jgi:GAF domain-containing protein
MRDLIRRIYRLDIYKDPINRFRAIGTYLTATVIFVTGVLSLLAAAASYSTTDSGDPLIIVSRITSAMLPIVAVISILLTRIGRQVSGGIILVFTWFIPAWVLLITTTDYFTSGIILSLIGVSLASLLIGPRSVIFYTVATLIVLLAALILQYNNTATVPNAVPVYGRVLYGLLLVVQGTITYSLSNYLPTAVRQVVANVEQRRLRLAEASNNITSRLLAARFELDTLFKETIRLVSTFSTDVSTVQLYMVDDDKRNATLVATTLADQSSIGHQIGIGSLNIIGRSTITGQTIIVRDSVEERAYRREAFLVGTHTELVLPLRVGEQTIGVLDVQSQNAGAFPPDDIRTMETLANQIATVIDNARLYAEAQSQLADNQRLYRQTRNSLREIERLNQQLTGGAWAEYMRGQPSAPAYTVDLTTGQVENFAEWSQLMQDATRRNQIVIRETKDAQIVSMPISVRGQPIGAMEFELALSQVISPDQMTVLQQVMERLGLAIENTRLFEETQRIAQREALVNEISARMQVTANVEAVVAAATQSLADAFHAPRVSIRLGNPERRDDNRSSS